MKHLRPTHEHGIGPLFQRNWQQERLEISGVTGPDFDGATYEPEFDADRLRGEMRRVYQAMSNGNWHTLSEISEWTRDPPQSISARLRDLRKAKFGSHTVNRRRRGDPKHGLFEYQLENKK